MEWPYAPYQSLLLAALLVYGLNFALGVSLQLGSRWHPRALHHGLYFLTLLFTALAALMSYVAAEPWWPLALLFAALLLVPRTHPGQLDHALTACLIALGFGLTAWRLL